jgi:hypothetical protein
MSEGSCGARPVAVRGFEHLSPGDPIMLEDVELAERQCDVEVRSGDALIVRTGCGTHVEERSSLGQLAAGMHASCLNWLVADACSVLPPLAINSLNLKNSTGLPVSPDGGTLLVIKRRRDWREE